MGGKLKGVIWSKIRDWWRKWTDMEWQGYLVTQGMVYAWVKLDGSHIYVGSTQQHMFGRCRTHLADVRKVLSWPEDERKQLCKDHYIQPLHEFMSFEPGEWVMLPVSGEARNFRRVERRLIRYFEADLNIKVKRVTIEKSKQSRPVKAIRDKQVKKVGVSLQPITTYTIGGKLYQDLFEALRNLRGDVTVEWDIGDLDVTNWKRLWKERIFDDCVFDKTRCSTWNEIKKYTKKQVFGEFKIEHLRKQESDPMIGQLVSYIKSKKSALQVAAEIEDHDVWKMETRCRKIRGKELRIRVVKFVNEVMRIKWNMLIPKSVTIKVPTSNEISRKELRKRAIVLLNWTNLHKAIKNVFVKRLRIVFTSQKTIKDILVNNNRVTKSMTKSKPICVCRQKRQHIAKRGSEWYGDGADILSMNNKYTPTPDHVDSVQYCCTALFRWWNTLLKWDRSASKKGSIIEMAKRATIQGIPNNAKVTEGEVQQVSKIMQKWMIVWLDKNASTLFICCPVWYWQKTLKTFDWKDKAASYKEVTQSKSVILDTWRRLDTGDDYFFSMKKTGDLPYGYVIPKEKDINKMRPIVSYYHHPWKHVLNVAARALTFLMKAAKVDQYVLWQTFDLRRRVKEIDDWASGKNEEVLMIGGDIKNMYTVLPHTVIIRAVEWLIDTVRSKIRGSRYIRVRKRGREGVKFGRAVDKSKYTELRTSELLKIVQFDLDNGIIAIGEILLRQTEGIPMGSPASPPIAILVCVKYEWEFRTSLGKDDRYIRMYRYIDDVWAVAKFKRDSQLERQRALKLIYGITQCYHDKMEKETEGVQWEGEVGTPISFLEAKISRVGGKMIMDFNSKNSDSITEDKLKLRRFKDYSSFGGDNKIGIVIGTLTRVSKFTTDDARLMVGVLEITRELREAEYPFDTLAEGCLRMWRKGKKTVWHRLTQYMRSRARGDFLEGKQQPHPN